MKLRIVVGVLSLSTIGLSACQEQQTPAEKAKAPAAAAQPAAAAKAEPTPPPAAEPPKPPEVPPKEVCVAATAAAKANDLAKLETLASGDLSIEGAKEHLKTLLANGSCGEAKEAEDKAQVPVTMGAGKKAKTLELPLTKGADGWKIDTVSLFEKHPAKKAKKAKGKKAKKGK